MIRSPRTPQFGLSFEGERTLDCRAPIRLIRGGSARESAPPFSRGYALPRPESALTFPPGLKRTREARIGAQLQLEVKNHLKMLEQR